MLVAADMLCLFRSFKFIATGLSKSLAKNFTSRMRNSARYVLSRILALADGLELSRSHREGHPSPWTSRTSA